MPNFDWLEQKKKQARMNRDVRQPEMASNTVMPVGSRYNIGARYPNDTGYGEDGVLQTDMPVAKYGTSQGPRMVHEGESMRDLGNGMTQVVSQRELVEEEQGKNIPGNRYGGKMPGYQQGGVMGHSAHGGHVSGYKNGGKMPGYRGGGQMPGYGIRNMLGYQNGGILPPITPSGPNPNQALTQKAIDQQKDLQTPGPNQNQAQNFLGQQKEQPQSTDLMPKNPTGLNQTDISLTNDINIPNIEMPKEDSPYEQQFQDAMGRIGQFGGYEAASQKYLDDQAAQQATEELVGAQRRAQAGVGGVEGRTAGLMQQRMHGEERADAFSDIAIGAMDIAEQANLQKAQMAMQGMTFEEGKRQFQEQLDFAKQKYGDQEGQRIAADINAGMSLEQIQARYPDANITEADYKQMQDYSPMGFNKDQWDYSKKIDAINTLIQQGGPENYKNVEGLFKETFGIDIDFSNALSDEHKEAFNEGWNNLVDAIAGGLSYEQWVKNAKADGTFDGLNMTESDIKDVYETLSLQNNPIYAAAKGYQDLVDQGIITPEEYDRIMDALTFGISHPEGFTFSDSFQVLDANGEEVGNFKTQKDADDYIAKNPDKDFTINTLKDGWVEYSGGETTPGPEGQTAINDTIEYFDNIGVYVDDNSRIQQFLDAHDGKIPDGFTKEQWDKWDGETGSFSRINAAFGGTGYEDLTKADKKMIDEIRDAQERIANDKGTDEDRELVGKINFELSGKPPLDFNTVTNDAVSGDVAFGGTGEGVVHMNYSYPTNMYNASHSANAAQQKKEFPSLSFDPEVKKYFDDNVGKMFEYDGQFYEIKGTEMRDIYIDPLTGRKQNVETLVVIDSEGNTQYISFGVTGSIID